MLALAGLIPGCSSGVDLPETAPVVGVVTYQGQPVEGADVTFIRTGGGQPARGDTDAQGKFVLHTYVNPENNVEGAVPGDYQVTVKKVVEPSGMSSEEMMKAAAEGQPAAESKGELPGRYADPVQTPLAAQVEAGKENSFAFDLTP